MLNIEITYNEKGQLKCPFISTLNNINQDIKKISTKYLLDVSNRYIIHIEKRKGIVGQHISYISSDKDAKILQDTFGPIILEINSDALYALLKDYKKNLKMLTTYKDTDRMVVTIDDASAIYIGRYITTSHSEYGTILETLNEFLNNRGVLVRRKEIFTMLNDDQIERVSESILKCVISDINVRITKQLVPGISNKFNVGLLLNIDSIRQEGNDEICDLFILQERKTVDNFHIYKVLKY